MVFMVNHYLPWRRDLSDRGDYFPLSRLLRDFVECVVGVLVPEFDVFCGADAVALEVVDVAFDQAGDGEPDRFSVVGDLGGFDHRCVLIHLRAAVF